MENLGTILVNQPEDRLRCFTFALTNSGTINLGTNDVISISGDFIQSAAGRLQFVAAGTTPGTTHGQVLVQGTAALDGKLSSSIVPPFQPQAGDAFELLTYTSQTGTFSTIEAPPAPAKLEWAAEYGATSFRLKLRAVGSLP